MLELLLYETDKSKSNEIRAAVKALLVGMRRPYRLASYFTCQDAVKAAGETAKLDVAVISVECEDSARKVSKAIRARGGRTAFIYYGCSLEGLVRLLIFRPSAYWDGKPGGLEAPLAKLCMEQRPDDRLFAVRNRDAVELIPHQHIECFESVNRKVCMYTVQSPDAYEFSKKLDEVEAVLESPLFVRCHQSFIVNLANVRKFDKVNRRFITVSGRPIDISKRSLSDVALSFEKYMEFVNG